MSLISCPACGEDFEIPSVNKAIYDFDNLICEDCHKVIVDRHNEFINESEPDDDWGNDDWE